MSTNELTAAVVTTGLLSQPTLVELLPYFGSDGKTKKPLASALKFGTEQRQSVALYSADFAKCDESRQMYMKMSKCLQFSVEKVRCVGLFNRLSALLCSHPKKKKNIALSGIILFCPTLCATDCAGFSPTATIEFGIVLKARRLNGNCFEELLHFGPHKAREGELTEVELDVEVPLEEGVQYCIKVEECLDDITGAAAAYEARDFGTIQPRVTATVGESYVCFGNISNWNPGMDHDGICISPQLIYKLRLKECGC